MMYVAGSHVLEEQERERGQQQRTLTSRLTNEAVRRVKQESIKGRAIGYVELDSRENLAFDEHEKEGFFKELSAKLQRDRDLRKYEFIFVNNSTTGSMSITFFDSSVERSKALRGSLETFSPVLLRLIEAEIPSLLALQSPEDSWLAFKLEKSLGLISGEKSPMSFLVRKEFMGGDGLGVDPHDEFPLKGKEKDLYSLLKRHKDQLKELHFENKRVPTEIVHGVYADWIETVYHDILNVSFTKF